MNPLPRSVFGSAARVHRCTRNVPRVGLGGDRPRLPLVRGTNRSEMPKLHIYRNKLSHVMIATPIVRSQEFPQRERTFRATRPTYPSTGQKDCRHDDLADERQSMPAEAAGSAVSHWFLHARNRDNPQQGRLTHAGDPVIRLFRVFVKLASGHCEACHCGLGGDRKCVLLPCSFEFSAREGACRHLIATGVTGDPTPPLTISGVADRKNS